MSKAWQIRHSVHSPHDDPPQSQNPKSYRKHWWKHYCSLYRLHCFLEPLYIGNMGKGITKIPPDHMKTWQKKAHLIWLRKILTKWGSTILLYLSENIIAIAGMTNACDPPMTAVVLHPNRVWQRVFNPDTKSKVCITAAFSSCQFDNMRELSIQLSRLKGRL